MDLSILIVSYNTREVLRDCLESIYKSDTGRGKARLALKYEIIVVDNNSSDGTVDMIKKEYVPVGARRDLPLQLIENKENGGFAKANNQAAQVAKGTYLFLLNSDTVLEPNTLHDLYTAADTSQSYIASCSLRNADGSYQPQGGALPTLLNIFTWMTNLDALPLISTLIPPYQDRREKKFSVQRTTQKNNVEHSTSHIVHSKPGWLGGTALLIRRDLYASLNGLDEHIFMYGEDVEFCYRAHVGGIYPHFFTSPQLIHYGQQSGSNEKSILGEFAGLKYMFLKHRSKWAYNGLRFLLKTGALLRMIMYTLLGNGSQRKIYAKAFKLA